MCTLAVLASSRPHSLHPLRLMISSHIGAYLALLNPRRDLAAGMRVGEGRRVALCTYCAHANFVEWLPRKRSPLVRRVHRHYPECVRSRGGYSALSHRSMQSFLPPPPPPPHTHTHTLPKGLNPAMERSHGRPKLSESQPRHLGAGAVGSCGIVKASSLLPRLTAHGAR